MVSTLLLFVNRLPEEAREEECDKDMRKLVYLLGLLFFMACGEDAKEGIIPEPDVPYDYSEFGGYHVKDTVGYDMATLEFYSSNDTAWIYAIKGQKVWFGMFNDNTKEQITEWKASSSEESDYTSSFLGNPFKVGDKYVCFMKIAPELYKPFLLKEESAISLKEREASWGSENFFSVREFGENILVYHPHFYGNLLYSSEGVEAINSVAFQDDPESDNEYLSGFKNDKVWFGIYENGELREEYTGENVYDRNIKINKGYGEYEEYFVKALSFGYSSGLLKTEWGYVFYPTIKDSESGGYIHDMFFCNGGKMFPVFVGTYYLDIRNWYDGSVLMGNKVVFSPEGKRLIEFENNDLGDDRMLSVFCKEPSSYTHIIRLMHARMWADYTVVTIDKYDLESKNSLWSVNVDALGECAVNSKFVAKVLGKDKNIWTMEVSVISFEGQEKISNFKLNTDTGEIIYL